MRIADIPHDGPPGEGWTVYDTFSSTEVLSLSYDNEQGNPPKEPYGLVSEQYTYYLGPPKPL